MIRAKELVKSMLGTLAFSITIFLSAFLLFQIQPLISRYILPWFGGTPAVWSVSLLFFQVLLLGGYAYAHSVSRRTRGKMVFYLLLLLGSVTVLIVGTAVWGVPLLPDVAWRPPNGSIPFVRVFLVLLGSVGFPYFLLSSTSPLLQSWFKYLHPSREPYILYSLSNLGSFLALISYPLIFEPLLTLRQQSWIWAGAYLVFAILIFSLALLIISGKQKRSYAVSLPVDEDTEAAAMQTAAPTAVQRFFWIALPACSSTLLLSITNQLTQEVAVIPFLWILPLSIYLFSFTITFSGEKWYPRGPAIVVLGLTMLMVAYVLTQITSIGVFPQILIFAVFLLAATLVCHGELYRMRPDANHLTAFYMLVSLGGAVGGVFVSLLAPVVFRGYWELHLGVLTCWGLVMVLLLMQKHNVDRRGWYWGRFVLMLLIAGATGSLFYSQIKATLSGVLLMERNFYGVARTRLVAIGDPPIQAYSLSHGITSHGFQYFQPERRRIPTSYYGKKSGIGLTLENFEKTQAASQPADGLRVGVIGLGAGTLAAYGQPGDYYRFYEINPYIIDLAEGRYGGFTFLDDSLADIEVISGDARIMMEAEITQGNGQNFDVLVVDAFSSDSIPVHLLTLEAFGIYLKQLNTNGVLAVHISNRYLDLAPLVMGLGDYYDLDSGLVRSSRDNINGSYPAVWILLSRNEQFFKMPQIAVPMEPRSIGDNDLRIWTDDYSNLLPVIKMSSFFKFR